MIRLLLGNVGSGKSAQVVREIKNTSVINRPVFTNIKTFNIPNVYFIKPEYIVKKIPVKTKRDGEVVYNYEFNKKFWVDTIKKHGAINVVIDEAHNYFNPRRSMSKLNEVMTSFLAMLRRILGSTDNSNGELVLITQLDRRLDIIAREMATNVTFSICHYLKYCNKCNYQKPETNETPEQLIICPRCENKLVKINHVIEVYKFVNVQSYEMWKQYKMKSYYKHSIINDIENYFQYYNTLQFDDLFEAL